MKRVLFLALAAGCFVPALAWAQYPSTFVKDPKFVKHGLVVSVDPVASHVGAEILGNGGNAVDAAVATALALAVTYPPAGNIGGGGFMVVRRPDGEVFTIDFRETAPKLATPTMFLDSTGRLDPDKVVIGWLTVGVPGSPAGLWAAHQKAGKLPWKQLVEPAVKLAQEGFAVDQRYQADLVGQEKIFRAMVEPARVYLEADGSAPKPGTIWKLPELAESLRRMRDHGRDGFYAGPTAEALDAAMQKHGGLVRKEDLASYKAVERSAVRGTYRGYEIISIGPPSSGGTTLIEMLGILEGFDLKALDPQSPRKLHLLAETMKRAFYDRAKYLGDPDFNDLPLDKLLSKAHADRWRQGIGAKAMTSATIGADILTIPNESPQTTHFSIIDSAGMMVSTTTTLEGNFGAKVIAEGTGFLLNNEMHDFNVVPGLTNDAGLIGTKPNLIAPGKRMLSSQTPTILLKDGKPFLVVGSPGGRTIINTVLQVIVNIIDHGMSPQAAVDAPRVHHAWQPDILMLEKAFPESLDGSLRELGHTTVRRPTQGDCHLIWIDPATGHYHPGIDRRVRGGAVGW